MTDFINAAQLASYLQVPADSISADLVVEFANGLVTEVVGENRWPLTTEPVRVKAITLEVAARGYRNPQAYTSVTVGIDDYDKTVRREGKGVDRVGVYLTEEERAELLSYIGATPRRVGSIRLGVPNVP